MKNKYATQGRPQNDSFVFLLNERSNVDGAGVPVKNDNVLIVWSLLLYMPSDVCRTSIGRPRLHPRLQAFVFLLNERSNVDGAGVPVKNDNVLMVWSLLLYMPSDVRRTSVGRPSDGRRTSTGSTSVGHPSDVHRTSVRRLSDVRRTSLSVIRSCKTPNKSH